MAKKQNYKYIYEHHKKKYDRIEILREKGDKEKIQKIAAERGFETTTKFINYCINKEISGE